MDSHVADEKLKELHVESLTVQANDRTAAKYDIDPEGERKLLRKIDSRLIPILWFLFMLAFLDRTNIGMFHEEELAGKLPVLLRTHGYMCADISVGNARILGMEEDLKMTGNSYNIALFIFVSPSLCCRRRRVGMILT